MSSKTIGRSLLEDLTQRIKNGEWERGKLMPSELAFSKEYDVSRSTVHWAMVKLQSEGLIVRVPGKGSAVSYEPHQTTIYHPGGVRRNLYKEEWAKGFRLIKYEFTECPDDVRALFGCSEADKSLYIVRLFYDETGRTNGIHYGWVRPEYAKYINTNILDTETVDVQMSKNGIKPARYEEFFYAASASDEDAHYLGISAGSPVMVLDENRYMEDGTAIYRMHMINRADALKLRFESGEEV
ncbi:MAG: GntR family transcriptional regulator [Lachnospiraceae bacterium]|nr:GntR family transcriptional regulator [Lachnospiraceae bacterium]